MILKKEGNISGAIAVIKKAIDTKKDQVQLYIYLSSLFEDNKDLSGAESILKEGIINLPASVDLHYSLGVIYEKSNRFAEGIREMETVLSIDPDNAEALNFIGYSYAERDINLDKAEALIVKALKLKPGNGFMIDSLGWVHFKQKKFDMAIKDLKEAIEILPTDAAIIEHLGDVYSKIGEAKEARQMYERALKIDPKNISLQKKLEDLTGKKSK